MVHFSGLGFQQSKEYIVDHNTFLGNRLPTPPLNQPSKCQCWQVGSFPDTYDDPKFSFVSSLNRVRV